MKNYTIQIEYIRYKWKSIHQQEAHKPNHSLKL